MARCFVIQPFDKGEFDERYDDILEPAIRKARIEPYRVDRDPGALIPIETIEQNIRDCEYCLADISHDNPNVWYEVGYGLARGKDVVLICSDERTKFPFDIRHRNIILYSRRSPRHFDKLTSDITARLEALAKRTKTVESISPLKPTEGLRSHEVTALALIMASTLESPNGIYPYNFQADMQKIGYTKIAATLAFEGLAEKKFVELSLDLNYNDDQVEFIRITSLGRAWCLANQQRFVFEKKPREKLDNDIPF